MPTRRPDRTRDALVDIVTLGAHLADPTAQLSRWLPVLLPWGLAVVLAMGRAGGLLLGLPSMSAQSVPRQVQAIVVLAISVGMVGLHVGHVRPPSSMWMFVISLASEFLYGLGLGFIIQLALAIPRVAGEIAGIEMGLSFSAVADPLAAGQSTASSALMAQVGVQLFLAFGLDRTAIRALAVSLDTIPLGTAQLDTVLIQHALSLIDKLVQASFLLAVPLMAATLCLKLAMAMLARVAPKLQIFTMAFALSIGVGLIMLNLAMPAMVETIIEQQAEWMRFLAMHVE